MLDMSNEIVKDSIIRAIENLDDFVGTRTSYDELPWLATQYENGNGTVLYSTYDTAVFLAENFFDVQEIVDEVGSEIIDTSIFFENPEKLHVQLYCASVDDVFLQIDWDEYKEEHEDFDENDFEITDEIINFIKGELL